MSSFAESARVKIDEGLEHARVRAEATARANAPVKQRITKRQISDREKLHSYVERKDRLRHDVAMLMRQDATEVADILREKGISPEDLVLVRRNTVFHRGNGHGFLKRLSRPEMVEEVRELILPFWMLRVDFGLSDAHPHPKGGGSHGVDLDLHHAAHHEVKIATGLALQRDGQLIKASLSESPEGPSSEIVNWAEDCLADDRFLVGGGNIHSSGIIDEAPVRKLWQEHLLKFAGNVAAGNLTPPFARTI